MRLVRPARQIPLRHEPRCPKPQRHATRSLLWTQLRTRLQHMNPKTKAESAKAIEALRSFIGPQQWRILRDYCLKDPLIEEHQFFRDKACELAGSSTACRRP